MDATRSFSYSPCVAIFSTAIKFHNTHSMAVYESSDIKKQCVWFICAQMIFHIGDTRPLSTDWKLLAEKYPASITVTILLNHILSSNLRIICLKKTCFICEYSTIKNINALVAG